MKSINVFKIYQKEDVETALTIRKEVFVKEQYVPFDEEQDGFEDSSHHFLATIDKIPCGAARWRYTDEGIKLERFAVLSQYRGNGIGSKLVKAVLKDIHSDKNNKNKQVYLHSQLDAVPLYLKFGFQKSGKMFDECAIMHYKMKLPSPQSFS
ncbi:MAG: GNAT family N-acetyltransferase [Bacteroidetes bacterium]|nr:GNAT family N-acetyltransferase [Bacteroidota bacterium]